MKIVGKSIIILLSLIILIISTACSGGGGGGGVQLPTEISYWANITTGSSINKDAKKSAIAPQFTVFNAKLYVIWIESNDTAYQIRVAVYNGNDDAPSWAFVDGNGTNGINKDATKSAFAPQLTVFNAKLYAIWEESNGTSYQIRVAVYNGNDGAPTWAFVDGNGMNGINKDATKSADAPQITVFNAKLYAIWGETNDAAYQIRAAVYNGNDGAPSWAFVDGNGTSGINKDATKSASVPHLALFNAKLYATWRESNGTVDQIRAAVYKGNDEVPSWALVDGNSTNGINKDATKSAYNPQFTVFNAKLYAIWEESNGTFYQIRAAVYNGNDGAPSWAFVDGNSNNGINKDATKDAYYPHITVFNAKLYAIWEESNSTSYQIRIAVFNGNDGAPTWAFVDGNGTNGINLDATKNAEAPQLTVFNAKLYAIWHESYQIQAAVWK